MLFTSPELTPDNNFEEMTLQLNYFGFILKGNWVEDQNALECICIRYQLPIKTNLRRCNHNFQLLITLVIQEAQLMPTNPRNASRGQEVIKHGTVDMLGMVSY